MARIRLALNWLKAASDARLTTMPRHFLVAPLEHGHLICFDARPSWGGAWLQLDRNLGEEKHEYYMHVTWNSRDEKRLSAKRGDPASQAIWEAFMMLLALSTWVGMLPAGRVAIEFRGDAKGVLQSVMARRAKSLVLNLIIAEAQLSE